jgi:hypothetical protein
MMTAKEIEAMGPLPCKVGETIAEIVARMIESDNHYFGDRSCATCNTISALLGRAFGCDRKR